MRQNKNTWFYIGGSGLDRTDDFQKFCGSGLDRIQFHRIKTGLGLKNFIVHSSLMTTQTPTTAEIEKWLQVLGLGFPKCLTPVWVRKKHAESCLSRFRIQSHLWSPAGVSHEMEQRYLRQFRFVAILGKRLYCLFLRCSLPGLLICFFRSEIFKLWLFSTHLASGFSGFVSVGKAWL